MEYDVFISYSRRDTQIVDQFVRELTAAGYRVWIDRDGISSGDQFTRIIPKAIKSSALVIFFSSSNSNASKWTVMEIGYALKKEKTIIPVRLDDTEYEDSIDFLLTLIDFIPYNSQRPSQTIERLISSIAAQCGKPAATVVSSPPTAGPSPEELNNLGDSYYEKEDYEQAVEYYRLAAEQGHARAQYNLGICYDNGHGVKQDYNEAVKWYRKAAEQGHAEAQNGLGACYEDGQGVAQDYQEAVKWYRKAAEQGNAFAQYNLGCCYDNGHGVTQDYEEAVKWYRKAAEQGNANAQTNLGTCYLNGSGVEEDEEEAVVWFRKAAEQGSAEAQYNLGYCYENDFGVHRDYDKAAMWYQKAAEQGDEDAIEALKLLEE